MGENEKEGSETRASEHPFEGAFLYKEPNCGSYYKVLGHCSCHSQGSSNWKQGLSFEIVDGQGFGKGIRPIYQIVLEHGLHRFWLSSEKE